VNKADRLRYSANTTVLSSNAISLTCCFEANARESGWLTRESGRVPPCVDAGCTRSRTHLAPGSLRRAYLVIVVHHPGSHVWTEPTRRIAFARLDTAALHFVGRRIAPSMYGVDAKDRQYMVGWIFRSFRYGLFSGPASCECSVHRGICTQCVAQAHVRFVWENGYSRVLPYGSDHWYRGVTDAVDGTTDADTWLQCCGIHRWDV
jgi:hypothetical protein